MYLGYNEYLGIWVLRYEDHSTFNAESDGAGIFISADPNRFGHYYNLLSEIQDQLQRTMKKHDINHKEFDSDNIRINTPKGTFSFAVHNSKVYEAKPLN